MEVDRQKWTQEHGIRDIEWGVNQTLYFWAPKSLQMVIAAMKLKDTFSLEGKL